MRQCERVCAWSARHRESAGEDLWRREGEEEKKNSVDFFSPP